MAEIASYIKDFPKYIMKLLLEHDTYQYLPAFSSLFEEIESEVSGMLGTLYPFFSALAHAREKLIELDQLPLTQKQHNLVSESPLYKGYLLEKAKVPGPVDSQCSVHLPFALSHLPQLTPIISLITGVVGTFFESSWMLVCQNYPPLNSRCW